MSKSEKKNISDKSEDVRVLAPIDWHSINWNKVDKAVAKLQVRIVKAQREGRYGKVRSLSRIMTRSFSAKATAVKQVTGNKGGNTPGVDGIVWNSPTKKAAGIGELVQRGYKAKPLRRVYIEKSNGKNVHWGFRRFGIGQCKHSTCWLLIRLRNVPPTSLPMDSGKSVPAQMRKKCVFGHYAEKQDRNGYLKVTLKDVSTTSVMNGCYPTFLWKKGFCNNG